MKTITIKRDSWHWKFMERLDFRGRYADDFCTYCRWLMLAFAWAAVLSLGILLAGYCILDFVLWIAAMLVSGQLIAVNGPGIIVVIILGIGATVGTVYGLIMGLALTANKAPEFVSADTKEFICSAWESFHDKVCFRIERE